MRLQRPTDPSTERDEWADRMLSGMKNRANTVTGGTAPAPLDHLGPGGRGRSEPDGVAAEARPSGTARTEVEDTDSAQPAEPPTPGGGAAAATRGKATGSPAAVATRPHLEGSEQGPR
jgi:hypothetical protein